MNADQFVAIAYLVLLISVVPVMWLAAKKGRRSTHGGQHVLPPAGIVKPSPPPAPRPTAADWRAATERVDRIHAAMLREIYRGLRPYGGSP